MVKLREEMRVLSQQSALNLTQYSDRITNLKATVRFFSQTCELVSSASVQNHHDHHGMVPNIASPQNSRSYKMPMSPGSRGDGTTVATERD